jgi:hypothetical protein
MLLDFNATVTYTYVERVPSRSIPVDNVQQQQSLFVIQAYAQLEAAVHSYTSFRERREVKRQTSFIKEQRRMSDVLSSLVHVRTLPYYFLL